MVTRSCIVVVCLYTLRVRVGRYVSVVTVRLERWSGTWPRCPYVHRSAPLEMSEVVFSCTLLCRTFDRDI